MRQAQGKGAAFTLDALDRDRSAMSLDDLLAAASPIPLPRIAPVFCAR